MAAAQACNVSEKIIEPIQSRCAVLRYSKLTDEQVATARAAPRWKRVLCCKFTDGASTAEIAWDYRILKSRNIAYAKSDSKDALANRLHEYLDEWIPAKKELARPHQLGPPDTWPPDLTILEPPALRFEASH